MIDELLKMKQGSPLDFLPKDTQALLKLITFLYKLDVIKKPAYRIHSISYNMMVVQPHYQVPSHWIPLAVVGLSREYIEIVIE